MSIDLSGLNILLTGASQGIGKTTANYLMTMGARVAIHYNHNKTAAVELAKQHKTTNSKIFKADLNNISEVTALFKEVKKEFGVINVIILNAGIAISHPIEKTSENWFEIWKKTMAVNLDAAGLLTKLGIEHFKVQQGGRFIYIGSRAAFRGETEDYLAYAASKGGLTSLARSVARSFGKENIKSFVIAPGFTKTQMADAFIEKYGKERILSEISLKELTKPSDIAPLIAFISSGLMDHATGATIDINAGSHIR